MQIGIQGVQASFHDVAARLFFRDRAVTAVECATFRGLCESLKNKSSDYCMMAIENSIAGSILPNYNLLENYHFKIIGEVYLRIEMCLMALPGQNLGSLRFVQSHPMAILQCDEFLNAHPQLKILEANDTAESAKEIRSKNLASHAAIASHLAAQTYGLDVLKKGIETNKQNYTRFLVIARDGETSVSHGADKASIRFQTAHKAGSLVEILEVFRDYSINMTKIQSVPILGKPYQYSFHVDLEWEDRGKYDQALGQIQAKTINLIHFGEYKRGERPSA